MLVIAVPVVGFNAAFADLLNYSLPDWSALPWLVTILGTVMYFWGGWPFLTGGIQELRSRAPGKIGRASCRERVQIWGWSARVAGGREAEGGVAKQT